MSNPTDNTRGRSRGPSHLPGTAESGPIEALWRIADIANYLPCSRRMVEQMRSSGALPPPDFHVGRCPRWKPETIRSWTVGGGKK